MSIAAFSSPVALSAGSAHMLAGTPTCPRLAKKTFLPNQTLRRSTLYPRTASSPSTRTVATVASATSNVQNVAAILLAGGSGSRMKADRPKQFLPLAGRPIVQHSIALFAGMPEVSQLIVVVADVYRRDFNQVAAELGIKLRFADPGKERQDSVYNGLCAVADGASLACIHDAARPLVTAQNVRDVLQDATAHGAAVLGVPSKATIKESADGEFVLRTIPRKRLWEIQTPQVIKPELLRRGFEKVHSEGLDVTDDVSIIEQLGEPVKITMGEYTNIKITTPEDMNIAESILKEREAAVV